MRSRAGIWLVLAMLAAIGALVYFGRGPGKSRSTGKPPVKPTEAYTATVRDIKLNVRDPKSGKPMWALKVGRASVDMANQREFYGDLEDVTGTLYERGEPGLKFHADKCSFDTNTQTVRIEGNVEGESVPNGLLLKADRLVWRHRENTLMAEGRPLLIRQNDQVELRDSKLIADTSLQSLRNYE